MPEDYVQAWNDGYARWAEEVLEAKEKEENNTESQTERGVGGRPNGQPRDANPPSGG